MVDYAFSAATLRRFRKDFDRNDVSGRHWAMLSDDIGPMLLPFVIRPETYRTLPFATLGITPTPLSSLRPRRGEMWVLFCFREGAFGEEDAPLRNDGFVLILEWRKGRQDSPLLSSALRGLADSVRRQLAITGWSLHPSFDRYGDRVAFTDAELFADAEHVGNVASAWGALAAGLWCAEQNRYPDDWSFPTLQWDGARSQVVGVAGIAKKLSVAADCGAEVVSIARTQRSEASGILADLRFGNEGRRFRNLRLYPVRDGRDPRDAAAEIAFGYANDRRLRRRIAAAVLIPLLALLSLWGVYYWDTHRSFSKYYAAVVYHYGLPEGIHELTPEIQRQRGSTFRFDYKGIHGGKSIHDKWQLKTLWGSSRKLHRMVHVNARNVPWPIDNDGFGQVPMIGEFEYDDGGKLVRVKSRRRGGADLVSGAIEKQFSYRDYREASGVVVTNGCVSLLDGDGNFWYGEVSLSQPDRCLPQDGKNVINHYVLRRDGMGRVATKDFRDGRLDPATDGDGVGGLAFEYNGEGLVSRRINLDIDCTNAVPDQWGVAETDFLWQGADLTNVVFRDVRGQIVRDRIGVMQYSYRYDAHGNPICCTFLDANGKIASNRPTTEWPNRFAECRFTWRSGMMRSIVRHGPPGRETDISLDAGGTPAGMSWERNSRGDVISEMFLDSFGVKTTNDAGICVSRFIMDDLTGKVLYAASFGPDGRSPVCDKADGTFAYSNVLDAVGNCILTKYLDGQGNLMTNRFGTSILHTEYDLHGRPVYQVHLGVDGKPKRSRFFPAVETTYERGRIAEWRYCTGDAARTATTNYEGSSRMVMQYDDFGRLIRRVFHSLPGTGNSIRSGKKSPPCARYEALYDGRGHVSCFKCYDEKGNLLRMPGQPYAYVFFEYDFRGRETSASYYDDRNVLVAPGSNLACRIVNCYASDGDYAIRRAFIAPSNTTYALWNHPGVCRLEQCYAPDAPHRLIECRYFGPDGKALPTESVVRIERVMPGSQAERLGVLAGDIICLCGEYALHREMSQREICRCFEQVRDQPEKRLVVARNGPDGYRLLTFTFSKGPMGIHFGQFMIPRLEFLRMHDLVRPLTEKTSPRQARSAS